MPDQRGAERSYPEHDDLQHDGLQHDGPGHAGPGVGGAPHGVPAEQPAGLIHRLRAAGQTVACAESLTGGMVCAALTSVPGASAVVRGGLVAYATELKATLAGVDPELLAEHGAVHPEVAAQLAVGARERCGAHWGLGLTGVAGPDPQDGVPAGTVYLALAGPESTTRSAVHADGDRNAVRVAAVCGVLDLLERELPGRRQG